MTEIDQRIITTVIPDEVRWEMDWMQKDKDGNRAFPNMPEIESVFEENMALALLLINSVIFLNDHWWKKDWPEDAKAKTSLNVNCNDIFAWGCADAEEMDYEDLESLYDHYIKDPMFGSAVWCIKKRKQMPQPPVYKDIQKAGIWNLDELELT